MARPSMAKPMKTRGAVEEKIATIEAQWIEASEALELIAA